MECASRELDDVFVQDAESGDTEEAMFDERYGSRDQEQLSSKDADVMYEMMLSADRMLSREMTDPRYQVRVVEQQRKWGFVKWQAQKDLAQLLFNFNSVWMFLKGGLGADVGLHLPAFSDTSLDDLADGEDEDDDEQLSDAAPSKNKINRKTKLVGVLVKGSSGDRVNFEPSESVYSMLLDYIDQFRSGQSDWTQEEFVEMLTEDYHLSYYHFIRGQTSRIMRAIDALRQQIVTENERNIFAESEGMTWNKCLNLYRLMSVQSHIIITNRNLLVETNLRAALHLAQSRSRSANKPCMGKLDLVNEAAMGLMHAADLYIPKCAAKFTTYATNWMTQRTGRFIKNNNSVRLPLHISDAVTAVSSAITAMVQSDPRFTHEHFPKKEEVEAFLSRHRKKAMVIKPPIWEMAMMRMRGQAMCTGGLDLNGGFDAPEDTFLSEENELSDSARDMKRMTDAIFSSPRLSDREKDILRYCIMHPDGENDLESIFGTADRGKLRTERLKAIKTASEILRDLDVDISNYFSDDYRGSPTAKMRGNGGVA